MVVLVADGVFVVVVVVVVDDDGGTESLLVSTFKLSAIDVPFDLMEDDDGDDDIIGSPDRK